MRRRKKEEGNGQRAMYGIEGIEMNQSDLG
jgi:hypothetical protein